MRADVIEQAVWDALARLLRDPQLLLEELHRRSEEGSATRTGLERELAFVRNRLQAVPREMDRLIEGFGKGLIPDDRMRARMGSLTNERDELTKKAEALDQKLQLALILEDVTCHSDHAIVRTVIPPLDTEPTGQLAASPRGGYRGMVNGLTLHLGGHAAYHKAFAGEPEEMPHVS